MCIAARRNYWASQLDAAYSFMMKVMDYPVDDCGERLVSLRDAAYEAGVEVTFSERPHSHGLRRIYVLREGQIAGFVDAARRLNQRGWIMHVEDGFRSRVMQKGLGMQHAVFDTVLTKVIWELERRNPSPDFLFKRLLTLVAQTPKTGTHMSGSAIDISVFERNSGALVDRGGPYLELSELTPMDTPFVSPKARHNRQEITAIMRESGFVAYPYEFWHYSSGDAYEQLLLDTGLAARYGPVDYDTITNQATPIEDSQSPLNTLEEIQAEIHASLERLKDSNTQ